MKVGDLVRREKLQHYYAYSNVLVLTRPAADHSFVGGSTLFGIASFNADNTEVVTHLPLSLFLAKVRYIEHINRLEVG